MKFIEKIEEGSDLFERFNEDLKQYLEHMQHVFPNITPEGFAPVLTAFIEKWQAFISCVRAGYIVESHAVPTTDNDNEPSLP